MPRDDERGSTSMYPANARGTVTAVFKADGDHIGQAEVGVRRGNGFLTVEEQTHEIERLRAENERLRAELADARRA